jgi:hypothetical protein
MRSPSPGRNVVTRNLSQVTSIVAFGLADFWSLFGAVDRQVTSGHRPRVHRTEQPVTRTANPRCGRVVSRIPGDLLCAPPRPPRALESPNRCGGWRSRSSRSCGSRLVCRLEEVSQGNDLSHSRVRPNHHRVVAAPSLDHRVLDAASHDKPDPGARIAVPHFLGKRLWRLRPNLGRRWTLWFSRRHLLLRGDLLGRPYLFRWSRRLLPGLLGCRSRRRLRARLPLRLFLLGTGHGRDLRSWQSRQSRPGPQLQGLPSRCPCHSGCSRHRSRRPEANSRGLTVPQNWSSKILWLAV